MYLVIRFAYGHWLRLASLFHKLAHVGQTVYCFECDHITTIISVEEE